MAKIVIKNKEQLKEFLAFAENSISEAGLFADDEKQDLEDKPEDKTGAAGGATAKGDSKEQPDASPDQDSGDDASGKEAGDTGPSDIDTGKVSMSEPNEDDLKKGSITMDMVVTKLNQLRSGRSLKDKAISAEMEKYFGDLDDNERLALYAFLKGITQIITGEISGEKATEPEDTNQIDITGRAAPGETKTMKVPVIHKGGPSAPQKLNPSKEDTTPPAPVQAKRRG